MNRVRGLTLNSFTLVVQGFLSLLSTSFISHWYGPVGRSDYAVVILIANLAASLSTFGTAEFLIAEHIKLLKSIFLRLIVMTTTNAVVFSFIFVLLLQMFSNPTTVKVGLYLPIILHSISISAMLIPATFLAINHQYFRWTATQILFSLAWFISLIISKFTSFQVLSFWQACTTLNLILTSLVLFIFFKNVLVDAPTEQFAHISLSYLITRSRTFFWNSLINTIIYRIDIMFIAVLLSEKPLGIYSAALSYASILLVISKTFSFHSFLSFGQNRKYLRLRDLWGWLILFIPLFFFAGIALFLVAPWAISKLNGPFFAESIMTAQILIVFIFFDQIYSLFDQYLKVLKNSAVPFFYFARVIIFLSVVYACSIRSPLGVAMARLVETIVSLTLIAIFITKHRFKITIFKTSNLFNWAARSPQTPE